MKVSVSVVSYQHAATIGQALESILLQEAEFDFEVIVGDDASTDGTQDIVNEYRSLAPETIRTILRDTNAGDDGLTNVLSTMDAAEGEYIAFLDGDDYWTDTSKLQQQVDFMDAHPECVICAHRVEHLREDGVRIPSSNAPNGGGMYDIGALIVRNFAPKISTIIRKNALHNLPDWYRQSTVTSNDWLLNVLVGRNGRVGFIDEVMAVHRIHGGSVSATQGTARMVSDKLRVIETLRKYIPEASDDLDRLHRQLTWKLRIARWSPGAYAMLKRLNDASRSRPN